MRCNNLRVASVGPIHGAQNGAGTEACPYICNPVCWLTTLHATVYHAGMAERKKRKAVWNAGQVHALRSHLRLTQEQMAEEMGTRQQTISEWETGQYQPRGASARLLTIVAERTGFVYGEKPRDSEEKDEG